jgi:hypothetical protein
MSTSWRVDATIVGGPAKGCAELLDYFRPPQSIPDTMATRSEPPRKRQKRGDQASIVCDDVDESAAILLASQDLVLVSQTKMIGVEFIATDTRASNSLRRPHRLKS